MSARGHLVNLWLSHARGESQAVRRVQGPPPHLQGATWKFLCECGYTWKLEGTDPVHVREGDTWKWIGPAKECLGCHKAVVGRLVE